jgi:hypothetical protein
LILSLRRFECDSADLSAAPVVAATETSSPVFGPMANTGRIRCPVFLIQHTHDTPSWSSGGIEYASKVAPHLGEGLDRGFRFCTLKEVALLATDDHEFS